MPKRRWFRTARLEVGLWLGVALSVLFDTAILTGPPVPLPVRLLFFSIWPILLSLISCLDGQWERGLLIDDEGLSLVRWFGRSRRVPWDDVHAVKRERDRVAVETRTGPLVFGAPYRDWPAIYLVLRARLDDRTKDQAPALDQQQMQALLAEAARGMECAVPVRWCRAVLGLPAGLLAWYGAWPAAVGLVLLAAAWATHERRHHRLSIDSYGLSVRRGRETLDLAWREVESLEASPAPAERFYLTASSFENDRLVTLRTAGGTVNWFYSYPGGKRLADAIERVLAARKKGHQLPERGLVNDASLSPARLTGTETERSLSLTRE